MQEFNIRKLPGISNYYRKTDLICLWIYSNISKMKFGSYVQGLTVYSCFVSVKVLSYSFITTEANSEDATS